MRIDWKIKHFNSLSTKELLFFVNLRVKVFVIEQNCPYPEADGLDSSSFHVICKNNSNQLIETARIILPSKLYVKYSIAKIVFRQEFRQISIGKQLLQLCISYLKKKLGANSIRIPALKYLEEFYHSFNFKPINEFTQRDTHMSKYFGINLI